MEQLLFLLFVLFSVVSVLLERRKRRRLLEAQKQPKNPRTSSPRQAPSPPPGSAPEIGWPFGSELLDLPNPLPPRTPKRAEQHEAGSQIGERETLAAERRTQELQRRAQEEERRAQEVERRARTGRQSVRELLRQRTSQEQSQPEALLRSGRWKLNARQARDAIVYAEILGRPKAERRENV